METFNIAQAGAIVFGVVGIQIVIRIIWKYLETRKNNPNGHFKIICEQLNGLEKRIIDRLDLLHEDIKDLKR